MFDRISAGIFVAIFASGVAGQAVEMKSGPKRLGSDPFSIERGSSFTASAADRSSKTIVTASSVVSDVQEALSVIRGHHIRTPSTGELAKTSIDSMLRSLDPHSNYYDRSEYAELRDDQRSEYFGTGSTIAEYERNGRTETYILSTYPGSSAERSGLRFGDRIVAINGRSAEDLAYSQIRDQMRGPRGTSVSLTLERQGRLVSSNLRRDRVPQNTVTDHYMLGNGVGIIRMPEAFSFTSYEEFDSAFRQLMSQGMTSLVYDLRGNSGGILDQSVKIAEKFLPEGSTIVSQRGRTPIDNRIWKSANRSPETLPIVVLVDEDTASAAEVVAGALQDNDRAIIVGSKTFGKGLVQSVIDLPSGGGLTLTTARYFTPSGRSLQRDYENNGAYDYYKHTSTTAAASKPSLTRTKRQVFGGDGITPDVKVTPEGVTQERMLLIDPIFHFVRGSFVKGRTGLSEDLITEFLEFASREFGVSEQALSRNAQFIRLRLAHDLDLASAGPIAASRTLLNADPQVAKALQAMPEAVSFASSYYVSRKPSKK